MARSLKNSDFTMEKQRFSQNQCFRAKLKKVLIFNYFGAPKPLNIDVNVHLKMCS